MAEVGAGRVAGGDEVAGGAAVRQRTVRRLAASSTWASATAGMVWAASRTWRAQFWQVMPSTANWVVEAVGGAEELIGRKIGEGRWGVNGLAYRPVGGGYAIAADLAQALVGVNGHFVVSAINTSAISKPRLPKPPRNSGARPPRPRRGTRPKHNPHRPGSLTR